MSYSSQLIWCSLLDHLLHLVVIVVVPAVVDPVVVSCSCCHCSKVAEPDVKGVYPVLIDGFSMCFSREDPVPSGP